MLTSCSRGSACRGLLLALALTCGTPAQALDGALLMEYFRNDTGRLQPAAMAERYATVVGQLTGMPLGDPVPIVELPREEARERLHPRDAGGGADEGLNRLLRHFGLLAEGESFAGWSRRVGSRGTQGLYGPESGEIVLVSGIGHRAQAEVLLHELVHAAQDRAASLERLYELHAGTVDGELTLSALLEGQAELVPTLLQLAQVQSRLEGVDPIERLIERYEEVIDQVDDGVGTLEALNNFPYAIGPYLVLNRLAGGGEEGFAGMLERLPASSEQALHGEKLLAGEPPLAVGLDGRIAPVAAALGGEVRYATTAGEYFIRALLASLPQEQRVAAAAGWGGDRVLLVAREGAGDLLVWDTRWDDQAEAEEFRRGYLAWAKARLGLVEGQAVAPFSFSAPGLLLYAKGDRVLIVEGEGVSREATRKAVAALF